MPLTGLIVYTIVLPLVVGVAFHLAPRLARPDLLFAVAVEPDFGDGHEGRRILTRYRKSIWAHTLAGGAIALVAMLSRKEVYASLGFSCGMLWQLAGVLLAFISARRKVMPHAVAPSRERETVTAISLRRLPGGGVAQIGPFAIIGATALYLGRHFAELPARIPVHWSAGGQPDRWATRTPVSAYGSLVLGVLVCLISLALAVALLRRRREDHAAGEAGARERRLRGLNLVVLLGAQYLVALVVSWITLLPSFVSGPGARFSLAALLVGELLLVGFVFLVLLGRGQGGRRVRRPEGG